MDVIHDLSMPAGAGPVAPSWLSKLCGDSDGHNALDGTCRPAKVVAGSSRVLLHFSGGSGSTRTPRQ